MKKIVSEDALRRALARMSAEQSQAWLQPHLLDSVGEALKTPWILDIDTTIKPLYGKREGAEVGYNPHKPGRPSHALHTYWAGNLRLVLDVVVAPGNKSISADTRPGLGAVLDRLQPEVFCWLSSLRKRAVWQARLQPPPVAALSRAELDRAIALAAGYLMALAPRTAQNMPDLLSEDLA